MLYYVHFPDCTKWHRYATMCVHKPASDCDNVINRSKAMTYVEYCIVFSFSHYILQFLKQACTSCNMVCACFLEPPFICVFVSIPWY